MNFKIKRAIKTNSEPNDGHEDGTLAFIFAELPISNELRELAVQDGVAPIDKMYYVFYPTDEVQVPVGTSSSKLEILSEELEDYTPKNFDQIKDYYELLESQVLKPMGFNLYN